MNDDDDDDECCWLRNDTQMTVNDVIIYYISLFKSESGFIFRNVIGNCGRRWWFHRKRQFATSAATIPGFAALARMGNPSKWTARTHTHTHTHHSERMTLVRATTPTTFSIMNSVARRRPFFFFRTNEKILPAYGVSGHLVDEVVVIVCHFARWRPTTNAAVRTFLWAGSEIAGSVVGFWAVESFTHKCVSHKAWDDSKKVGKVLNSANW